MTDSDAREWERRWRTNPGDLEALERAITLRRRAGETVPWSMLEARQQPPRTFDATVELDVYAVLPAGRKNLAGRTPGEVTIPRHRRWWVKPDAPDLTALAAVLAEAQVPGLSLAGEELGADALSLVATIDSLSYLSLSGCTGLAAPKLRQLTQLRQLEALVLGRSDELLSYLDALAELPLTYLGLAHSPITARGLKNLVAFPGLTGLELGGESMRPDVLLGLAEMPTLEWLALRFGDVRPALPHLPRHLTHLTLAWAKVLSDADLASLSGLTRLRQLDLSGCVKLTGSALNQLNGLDQLRRLDLVGCEAVKTLKPLDAETLLPALEHLNLKGTAVPPKQVERLRKRRPTLQVTA